MTKDEALRLALSTLNEVRQETFRLMRNGQTLYAEAKVWSTITVIREALAQPEQEPVIDKSAAIRIATALGWEPKRKPLTDEEIILIVADCASSHQLTDIHFARAIEAAHGIKE